MLAFVLTTHIAGFTTEVPNTTTTSVVGHGALVEAARVRKLAGINTVATIVGADVLRAAGVLRGARIRCIAHVRRDAGIGRIAVIQVTFVCHQALVCSLTHIDFSTCIQYTRVCTTDAASGIVVAGVVCTASTVIGRRCRGFRKSCGGGAGK